MSLEDAAPVVLVGAGKMGTALARGWIAGGLPGSGLTLVEPNPSPALTEWADHNKIAIAATAPHSPARVLVLAVKPQVVEAVMPGVRASVGAGTLVVSIAAGIPVTTLRQGLATDRIVRTMPNTPAQVGKGVTGAFAPPAVDADDRAVTEALLAAAGIAVWVGSEADLDALTAVSGSGPAYVFHLVEAMAAAGVAEGLDDSTAMTLARQTVIGAAALMEADAAAADELRQNVTSPGGATAAALDVLMAEDGLTTLVRRAIRAARKRTKELGS